MNRTGKNKSSDIIHPKKTDIWKTDSFKSLFFETYFIRNTSDRNHKTKVKYKNRSLGSSKVTYRGRSVVIGFSLGLLPCIHILGLHPANQIFEKMTTGWPNGDFMVKTRLTNQRILRKIDPRKLYLDFTELLTTLYYIVYICILTFKPTCIRQSADKGQ